MISITDLLSEVCVIDELKAKTKKEVLYELSEILLEEKPSLDSAAVVDVLLDREKLGSTGIGEGIAIPHGKMASLERLIVSFGRSTRGVDFEALDGKPAYLFFLLMAPENSAGQHLKALAKISRMLKDETFRQSLMKAESKTDLYNLIREKDLSFM